MTPGRPLARRRVLGGPLFVVVDRRARGPFQVDALRTRLDDRASLPDVRPLRAVNAIAASLARCVAPLWLVRPFSGGPT